MVEYLILLYRAYVLNGKKYQMGLQVLLINFAGVKDHLFVPDKGKIVLSDKLSESTFDLNVAEGKAEVRIDLEPLQSYILQFP